MKAQLLTAAAILTLGAGSLAFAQPPAAPPAAPAAPTPPAIVALPAKGGAKLTVTSPAFQNGGDIPFANTQYQGNHFPGLAWTAGPATTKSYAIIMQDTDGPNGRIILHWTMYNIPATIRSLPADMAPEALPAGSSYGPNIQGANRPYFGPRTPAGPKHNYHIQVFALDTTLTADPAMLYPALEAALKDHVLASGEVVGLGSVDPNAPPPPARGGGGGGGGRGGAPGAGAPAGGPPAGGAPARGPGQ